MFFLFITTIFSGLLMVSYISSNSTLGWSFLIWAQRSLVKIKFLPFKSVISKMFIIFRWL